MISAAPATAQSADAAEPELPEAPDWFVEGVVDLTTAQRIALSCRALDVDVEVAQAGSNAIMARLMSEGYDISREDGGMLPTREKFLARQMAFMERHEMAEGQISEDMVCAAGRREIAEDSGIGRYLTEVGG